MIGQQAGPPVGELGRHFQKGVQPVGSHDITTARDFFAGNQRVHGTCAESAGDWIAGTKSVMTCWLKMLSGMVVTRM